MRENGLGQRGLVEAVLARYGLRPARLRRIGHGPGRWTFRVESDDGRRFVLKTYRFLGEDGSGDLRSRTDAGLRSAETLRAQLLWVSALGDAGLLVPEPLSAGGELVGGVPIGHEDPGRLNFALLRWVPGENRGEDLTPDDLVRVGTFVARMHDLATGYSAPALPRWDWHWPFGASAHLWSKGEAFYSAEQMDVFGEAARRVRRDLMDLGYGRERFGPIHRDLTPGNLLFRAEGVGAVDFDQCGMGHYLLDLAVILASLRPIGNGRLGTGRLEPLREALLEGYERERGLPPDYQRYLTAFNVMRRVAAVNRDLALLTSTPGERRRARGHRFLRNAATWISRNYP